MKLYHVSEEPNIEIFVPRESRMGMPLVWALCERTLPNFLTPRDCPRVTYHAHESSTEEDIARFFSATERHCVAIEPDWHKRMLATTLYVYEFDSANFKLGDESAGYYVSECSETPVAVMRYDDLYAELFKRNVEVRHVDDLWKLGRKVQQSTLHWSLCRMGNAKYPQPPLNSE